MQEEYIKDEQKNLKKEYLHAQEEVKRIQSVPLVIGQFLEAVDQNTGIVGSTTGHCFMIFFLFLIDSILVMNAQITLTHLRLQIIKLKDNMLQFYLLSFFFFQGLGAKIGKSTCYE